MREEEKEKQEKSLRFFAKGLRALWELLGSQKKKAVIILVLLAVSQFLDLTFPLFLKSIFDNLEKIFTSDNKNYTILIELVLAMYVLSLFTNYFNRYILEKKFLKILIYLENHWPKMAQKKLLRLSLGYHEKENTGKKISKIDKGCERLGDTLCRIRWGLLPQLFYLTINIIIIFALNWKLGILFSIPFFPAIIINMYGWNKFSKAWEEWDEKKEIASGSFCQSILNVKTVQNYVQEEKEYENFSKQRNYMHNIDIDASLKIQKYFFAMNVVLKTFFVLTIFVGLKMVLVREVPVGTLVYIIATGNVTMQNIWGIIHEYIEMSRKLISVIRFKNLMDEENVIPNKNKGKVPKKFIGILEFSKARFAYYSKDRAVIDGLNLNIVPNKMTALVGKSGEGKTTIFNLLCRMHDLKDGEILLDGVNIKDIDLFWYRKLFAIVQQDVDIFDTTVRENILYAHPDSNDDEVIEALRAAYLDVMLNDKKRFPKGLDTEVGERGVQLSGGERQRVGIARAYLALLNDAKILVLDEATSNLDSQAERAIQEMIGNLRKKMKISIFACAHRLSTIQKADMIYVIQDGAVIEKGNHEKLLKRNGLYASLVNLQRLGEIRE